MPLAHAANRLQNAICQPSFAQPIIPQRTVQTSKLLRKITFGPFVRLCPSFCYQRVCNISTNLLRDGLTKLYRTSTKFFVTGQRKGWAFVTTGHGTFRWAPWQLVTLFVLRPQQPIRPCVTDVPLAAVVLVDRRRLTAKLCSYCSVQDTVVDSDTVAFLQYSTLSR